jgi:hypothetical protein
MRKALDNLEKWFKEKGLYQEEFPYFIKDILSYMDQKENMPLNSLNQELEILGWGIQIMDEAAYRQMLILHQRKNVIALKGYLNRQF